MALVCAAEPTRDTLKPTLTAGRIPWLKSSVSKNIWPSVIEITLVGINALTSLACVSITGSAVRDPPPFSSFIFAALSRSLLCR